MESTCYLLKAEDGKPVALFSGDTLFIGDVGRPDLAQKLKSELTPEILAGYLYDSLRNKIMPLNDDIVVYPAHGPGSACGKMMSKEITDTLGHQKKFNYALRADMTRQEFTKELLTGFTVPPQYFPENVTMNIRGYDSIEKVLKHGTRKLNVTEFETVANATKALLLDTRDATEFAKGFIPGSVNIGINGNFAPWVGTLIPDIKLPILLITDEGREKEVVIRLARVGYDGAIGHLEGGFQAWKKSGKEVDTVRSITAEELATVVAVKDSPILDVRKKSEYDAEHLIKAENAPLDYVNESMLKINKERTTSLYCAGGYRSMIFASILKARGFEQIVNVEGGFMALKESGKFRMTNYVKPITEL